MQQNTNILFITSDQQHWTAMGYLNPEVSTPNLDRMVKRGTTFQRAYTVNPTCTPTRARVRRKSQSTSNDNFEDGLKCPCL